MRTVLTLILKLLTPALLLALLASAPASASGTRAWSSSDLTLYEGPGGNYVNTGAIAAGQRITVDRCQRLWCVVHLGGQAGWTRIGGIRFGIESRPDFTGPRLNYAGSGAICLYEGTNYTGASVCVSGGQVFNDLLNWGLDNRFSSIEIKGTATVAMCRDRFFQSYCARIVESQPVLPQFLNNAVSSIKVF